MKKIITISLILLLVSYQCVKAQTEKKNLILGGSARLFYDKVSSDNWSRGFYLDPKVGLFVANNLCAGITLPSSLMSTRIFSDKVKSISLGFGPFLRYYIPARKVYWVSEVQYSWVQGKVNHSSDIVLDNVYGNRLFRAGTGIALFLNQNVSVEGLLNYSRTTNYQKVSSYNLSIGLQYYFRRQ